MIKVTIEKDGNLVEMEKEFESVVFFGFIKKDGCEGYRKIILNATYGILNECCVELIEDIKKCGADNA